MKRWKTYAHLVLFLTLWVSSWQFPGAALTPQLDPSWQGVLSHATEKNLQFGRDIVFTYGPYGHYFSEVYSGYGWTGLVLSDLFLKAVFAGLILWIFRRIQSRSFRWAFLIFVFIFSSFQRDGLFVFMIVALGILLLQEGDSRRSLRILVPILFAFLSLVKFTYFFLILIILGVLSLFFIREKKGRVLLELGIVFPLGLAGLWMMAGQQLRYFPDYLKGSLEISKGYSHAMAFPTQLEYLWLGLFILFLTFCIMYLFRSRDAGMRWAAAVLIFYGGFFIAWKHGFVRGDRGHLKGFFVLALWFPFLLRALDFQTGLIKRILIRGLSGLIIIICLFGIHGIHVGFLFREFAASLQRTGANLKTLIHLGAHQEKLTKELDANKQTYGLPALSSIIKENTVDVMGHEPGAALLNGWNYHPRPVFQSYFAYTPWLLRANEGFHAQNTASAYILAKVQSVDDRLPPMDDSLAWKRILWNYIPENGEKGYLLLRRQPTDRPQPPFTEVWKGKTSFDEKVAVPYQHGSNLWVRMTIVPSFLGKMVSIPYKLPSLWIDLWFDENTKSSFRFSSLMSVEGFLISPFVETNEDLLALYQGSVKRRVQHLAIRTEPGAGNYFADEIHISFLGSSSVVPSNISGDLKQRMLYPMMNTPPDEVISQFPTKTFSTTGSESVLGILGTSEMKFNVPAQAKNLTAFFGLLSVPNPPDLPPTDGVEFMVDFVQSGQQTNRLRSIFISPAEGQAAWEMRRLDINLPPHSGGELLLKTGPGPQGNQDWDWSYWTGIRIE